MLPSVRDSLIGDFAQVHEGRYRRMVNPDGVRKAPRHPVHRRGTFYYSYALVIEHSFSREATTC